VASKTGVLGVIVVASDPELVRVIKLSEVERLKGLKGSVADNNLQGERALDKRIYLGVGGVVLDCLAKIDESRGCILTKNGLGADELKDVADGREAGEGGIGDFESSRL
jgi:hypothetical protein